MSTGAPYKRHSYADGKQEIISIQKQYRKPPARDEINKHVERTIKKVGLRGSNQEQHFRLWATCALLNQEPLCRYWRRK